ncbi:5-hydroxyisourate hydrolase [Chelonus insularis]|uniref:5-hydroxyisourate hydrolase n=1 Tax=Chelonus insularis TaxID=460826 RepID=UPI00158F0A57|nr:5-hydroxyisourate hydrolase [Chelonus insularis]
MEQPHISTHVLDTSQGVAVSNLHVCLYKKVDDIWIVVSESQTNLKGRCSDFLEKAGQSLTAGCYKFIFNVGDYFSATQRLSFYPTIEIIFDIQNPGEHYHIPLLLNPFGFSTYRGTA